MGPSDTLLFYRGNSSDILHVLGYCNIIHAFFQRTSYNHWFIHIQYYVLACADSAHLDSHAYIPSSTSHNPYLLQADPDALPEMYDLPIGVVNEVLFRRNEGP